MSNWLRRLRLRHRFELFLTRGNSFIVLGGRLYLSQHGNFSRFLPKPKHIGGFPEEQILTRVMLPGTRTASPRHENAILISGLGRFGNMVIQLANIVLLAKKLDISLVLYWHNPSLGESEIRLGPRLRLKKAELSRARDSTHPTHLLRTRAFTGPKFPDGLSSAETAFLRQSLSDVILPNRSPRADRRSKSVVIHLRSGDVFWENPHPDYGQPPLSFYELVLNFDGWDEVLIVAEDDTNPCFDGIKSLCVEREIPFQVAGRTLDDALSTIVSATTVAMSRGTFVGSILWLKPANRHIFCFGANSPTPFPLDGTVVTRVIDVAGDYEEGVLNGNWKNSSVQRELMLSYPISNLELRGTARG